jgi:outer membrane protein, heavy metal efflux system
MHTSEKSLPAIFLAGTICLFMASCTKMPQADDCQVAQIVQERIAKRVHWNQGGAEDEQVRSSIELLLTSDLQLDAAVQIALLNNPQIQASFEELGIAQADLVQAGLFQNPIFSGIVRVPVKSSYATNTEFSITQSFLELFLIPLRKKVAATELEQAHLRVANMVLDLAFDVRETYYRLQAEQTNFGLLQLLVEARAASNSLAHTQYQAGNINELELQGRIDRFLQAKLEISTAQSKSIFLRKKLNTLLGLRPSAASWHIPDALAEMPLAELSVEELEKFALSQRLDLSAARLEMKKLLQMGAAAEWWAYTDPALGVSWEKDIEGARAVGPSFSAALPLFNHGQADRARLFALFKQSQYRVAALEIDIVAQLRMVQDQLSVHRHRVLVYLNEYLPLQAQIVTTSQNFYNVMGLSIYTFLQNKEHELQAKIAYTTALCDYWISRVELDRVVGGTCTTF